LKNLPHISVCICTYKRPDLLRRCLEGMAQQETEGRFSYSIVVVDNDSLESAKPVVSAFAATAGAEAIYCVEPRQNIALARNKALEHVTGDFVAFFDDDQFPTKHWLRTLFLSCEEYKADGVLGPVKPHFDVPPPAWVVKGKFCERPTYPTGLVIDWRKGRTGNVLLRRRLLCSGEQAFRREFITGEGQDFFRRMIERGHRFVWCNEAVAFEVVPAQRWELGFMLRRALLRGRVSLLHPTTGAGDIAKSLLAVPVYCLALPLALFVGKHRFILCLFKLFHHAGKILGWLGLNLGDESYVTE
jgi:succinoglycan biosynthesis protein ExoM